MYDYVFHVFGTAFRVKDAWCRGLRLLLWLWGWLLWRSNQCGSLGQKLDVTHVQMRHAHTWSHDQLRMHIRYNCYIPTSQAEMDSSLVWCQHKIFHPENKISSWWKLSSMQKTSKNCYCLRETHVPFQWSWEEEHCPMCILLLLHHPWQWLIFWPSFGPWFSSSETKTRHLKPEMTGISHHSLGSEVVSNAQLPGIVTQDSRSARSVRRGCVRVVSGPSFFWVILYYRTWELLYISLLAVNDVVCMPLYALVRW